METILKINEYSDNEFDGYEIETSQQKIQLLISNGQSCCESWGYLTSNDDLDEFIGSELLEIQTVDKSYNKEKLEENGVQEYECIFIDLVTNQGLLQFVLYNSHNGYYGHTVLIKSTQLTEETGI